MAIEVLGVKLGIRVNMREALDMIIPHLPPGWQAVDDGDPVVDYLCAVIIGGGTRRGVKRYHILYGNAVRIVRTLDINMLCHRLGRTLDFAIGVHTRQRVFVHAGVVGWQGQALLIPGRSHSGKTTLVKALIAAGATYYADEFAVLDAAGLVHPWPRPLNSRTGPKDSGTPVSPGTIGARTGIRPLPVGGIIDTQYVAGALWVPAALSPARAALCLMDNTLIAKADPRFALPILTKAAQGCRGLSGLRGEARDMAAHRARSHISGRHMRRVKCWR